eukprot:scaffold124787_cov33-Tisochrysis_lutea.AAC.1
MEMWGGNKKLLGSKEDEATLLLASLVFWVAPHTSRPLHFSPVLFHPPLSLSSATRREKYRERGERSGRGARERQGRAFVTMNPESECGRSRSPLWPCGGGLGFPLDGAGGMAMSM